MEKKVPGKSGMLTLPVRRLLLYLGFELRKGPQGSIRSIQYAYVTSNTSAFLFKLWDMPCQVEALCEHPH